MLSSFFFSFKLCDFIHAPSFVPMSPYAAPICFSFSNLKTQEDTDWTISAAVRKLGTVTLFVDHIPGEKLWSFVFSSPLGHQWEKIIGKELTDAPTWEEKYQKANYSKADYKLNLEIKAVTNHVPLFAYITFLVFHKNTSSYSKSVKFGRKVVF